MDANGLRFWMLADGEPVGSKPADWLLRGAPPTMEYDRARRCLLLRSERRVPVVAADATARTNAERLRDRVPHTRDLSGSLAWWSESAVLVRGAAEREVEIYRPTLAPGEVVSDLVNGADGVLYVAAGASVHMIDLRGRWKPVQVPAPNGFVAWRLAPLPQGGVLAMDPEHRTLARLTGTPRMPRPARIAPADIARPAEVDSAPKFTVLPGIAWPAGETPVAIAAGGADRAIVVLSWDATGTALVRAVTSELTLGDPVRLLVMRADDGTPEQSCRFAWTMSFADSSHLAVRAPDVLNEALVYRWPETGAGVPSGDLYPLSGSTDEPFVHSPESVAYYLRPTTGATDPDVVQAVPLIAVSSPSRALAGVAINARAIDSGATGTTWHRLYLEACFPPRCGVRVFLAATDAKARPADNAPDWFEHQFGSVGGARAPGVPLGTWVAIPSEIPFHPGFVGEPPEAGQRGLFTALVQRAGRRVRALRGRHLHVRVQLIGDGRSSPELFALRVYASRFSYVERYYPELYQETVFGVEADEKAPATRQDFFERFVANVEGVLTSIEDRIASSYLLTDARSAPTEALPWLATWNGAPLDPTQPEARQRRTIREAHALASERGTKAGLTRAIDIATDGACAQGDVLVVEDFLLRRTFGTILGADLAAEDDPFFGGAVRSGNSVVGDTLILGSNDRRALLALFSADQLETSEQSEVVRFLDNLAWRVTVLVRRERHDDDRGTIRRVVAREVPAHVLARVVETSAPLMVAVRSLIGVDTYLREKNALRTATLNRSAVGAGDRVRRPPTLDPRFEGDWE